MNDLTYYLGLPWTFKFSKISDDGAYYLATVEELKGCISHGDTLQEAVEMIQDALKGYLEVCLEDNTPIPEPLNLQEFSGKFQIRPGQQRHFEMAKVAKAKGMSINQAVNVAIDYYLKT